MGTAPITASGVGTTGPASGTKVPTYLLSRPASEIDLVRRGARGTCELRDMQKFDTPVHLGLDDPSPWTPSRVDGRRVVLTLVSSVDTSAVGDYVAQGAPTRMLSATPGVRPPTHMSCGPRRCLSLRWGAVGDPALVARPRSLASSVDASVSVGGTTWCAARAPTGLLSATPGV